MRDDLITVVLDHYLMAMDLSRVVRKEWKEAVAKGLDDEEEVDVLRTQFLMYAEAASTIFDILADYYNSENDAAAAIDCREYERM